MQSHSVGFPVFSRIFPSRSLARPAVRDRRAFHTSIELSVYVVKKQKEKKIR